MDNDHFRAVWPGWETVRLLGRGAVGTVYEIRREIFGTAERAALKLITIPRDRSEIDELRAEGYGEDEISRLFTDRMEEMVGEYTVMSRLRGCANVVSCDDIRCLRHENEPGWDVLIKMELLQPLMKVCDGMEEREILRLGRDIAAALACCHREKILHRDVKPQNIFVSREGTYKLGDFGVAEREEKVGGGLIVGTKNFVAPEVFNNLPYGASADLYSLGLVLYWLLNERRTPFLPLPPGVPTLMDKEEALSRRFGGEAIPAPAHGSPELRRIVLKALACDPGGRYQSAEEMLRDLEAAALRLRREAYPGAFASAEPEKAASPRPAMAPRPESPPQASQAPTPEAAPQPAKKEGFFSRLASKLTKPRPAPVPPPAQAMPGPTPAPAPAMPGPAQAPRQEAAPPAPPMPRPRPAPTPAPRQDWAPPAPPTPRPAPAPSAWRTDGDDFEDTAVLGTSPGQAFKADRDEAGKGWEDVSVPPRPAPGYGGGYGQPVPGFGGSAGPWDEAYGAPSPAPGFGGRDDDTDSFSGYGGTEPPAPAPAPPYGGGYGQPAPPYGGGYGQPAPPYGGGFGQPAPPYGGGYGQPAPSYGGGFGQPAPPYGGGYGQPVPPYGGGFGQPAPPYGQQPQPQWGYPPAPVPARMPRVSEVQFSALFPKRFLKGEYSILELYIYEEEQRKVLDEAIAEAGGSLKESRSGKLKVSENAQVSVRLESADPSVEIEGNEETQTWCGGYLKFDFSVYLPDNYPKRQLMFTATVLFNGVPATKLRFTAECNTLREQKMQVERQDVLSAFVSYASQDRSRVAGIIQGMQRARPDMDLFFDVDSLRSGEDWQRALRAEIERRDILFLCWSVAAKSSAWVDREWRYALENKGLDCIEPIAIDPPSLCPPPAELESKSFNDRTLYYVRG